MDMPSRPIKADNAKRIRELEDQCREERQRGLAGHWTYSYIRHQQLMRELKRERHLECEHIDP
jgi:hypothetical protein